MERRELRMAGSKNESISQVIAIDAKKETVKNQISEALRKYHAQLVKSGKAATYILRGKDFIHVLQNMDADFHFEKLHQESELESILRSYYSDSNLSEILEGVGLPHRPNSEWD